MRTTLTIDDDIAAIIDQRRREDDRSLKDIVNDALRRGLLNDVQRSRDTQPFTQPTFSVGAIRLANLDDVAEVLALAEGESHR